MSKYDYNKIYNDNMETQQLIIEKQDIILDSLHDEMTNLKEIALNIGNEVDDQDRLLNDLSENTTNANIRVNNSNKKIDKIMILSKNKYTITIITLIIIIIILIIVYFSK